MSSPPTRSNRDLLLPYLLPYLGYVLPGLVFGEEAAIEAYLARFVLCGGALVWGRRAYVHVVRRDAVAGSLLLGAAAGLAGTALWVLLLAPFVPADGDAWGDVAWGLRLAASGSLPPLFEELLLRGWVLGVAVQWDLARREGHARPFARAFDEDSIAHLAPGAWTGPAVAISTLLFAAGHATPEWPAALAYGALMCALWIARRDLLSCMTAHAVTNIALALYVRQTGQWAMW